MISVIIPVFNAESKLRLMLECVLNQTYSDFECILIDDGSKDGSFKICREYAEKDQRFKCFSQSNSGVSAARNKGMELSKGDYITFLDADDRIPDNYFSVLETCCQKGDISVCDVIVEQSGKEVNRFSYEDSLIDSTQALNTLLSRKKINSGPCAKMFRKEVISGIKFPALKTYEDILFVCNAFDNASTIVTTNKTGYYYVQNSNGAMSEMINNPLLDVIVASDLLMKFIKENLQLSKECCYVTVSHVFQYVLPLVKSRNFYDCEFLLKAREFCKKYMSVILFCQAIPWKEKVVFWLFTHGWVYCNRKFTKIKK